MQDFEFDKDNHILTQHIEWCGDRIELSIEHDVEDNMLKLIFIANELVQNQVKWNNYAQKFTSEYFFDSANSWRCGEGCPVTIKDIVNMLQLNYIAIFKDTTFVFTFDDSIIFRNHSTGKHYIVIMGTLEEGFYEADTFSY